MEIARRDHSSTTLRDGNIFICGGQNSQDVLSSCELFNVKNQTFTKIGNMYAERLGHASVLLKDNRVLIIGGSYTDVFCEIYNPTTNTFTLCQSGLINDRASFSANLLPDGKVIVFGGFVLGGLGEEEDVNSLQSTEIYNPTTDSFSYGPKMRVKRFGHASTTLLDGRILITGGGDENRRSSTSTEIYDPSTDTFVDGPKMLIPRKFHSSSLLDDGRVLVSGGMIDDAERTTEIYDPTTNSFTMGPDLLTPRVGHASSSFNF